MRNIKSITTKCLHRHDESGNMYLLDETYDLECVMDKRVDRVADLILQVFKDAGLDESYLQGKRKQFEGMSRMQCIFYVCNLDADNKYRFAQKIGVKPQALDVALDVFKRIA